MVSGPGFEFAAMIASRSEQSESHVPSAVSVVFVTVNVDACATDADPTTTSALITNSMVETATLERTLEPRFTFPTPRAHAHRRQNVAVPCKPDGRASPGRHDGITG